MAITIEQVEKPTTKTPGFWLIKIDNQIVGRLERFKGTRSTIHPWKAFKGRGLDSTMIGAFYEDGSVPPTWNVQFGGREAAIKAIVNAANLGR